MWDSVEELVKKLRGPKVPFFLVDAETMLLDPGSYPFPSGKAPIQCILMQPEPERFEAYTSGDRSVILPHGEGWFKAKAIGIPTSASQPILKNGRIHSYFLTNDRIGSGSLIWGFSQIEEAENELRSMQKIHDLVPSPKPVGIGIFRNLSVKEFNDRFELFNYLKATDFKQLAKEFSAGGRSMDAASVYCLEPTDIRVDEILYGFISPELCNYLEVTNCKDYLKWLGSSCGNNLRLLHDNGILHGSILRYGGVMTNSHVGNHMVNEDSTWITDFHMSQPVSDERFKEIELECLTYVMNPLESAERIGRRRFMLRASSTPIAPPQSAILNHVSSAAEDFQPTSTGEELSMAFIDGIEYGYFGRKISYVETSLRREVLEKAAELRRRLWRALSLAEGMQRGAAIVRELMARRTLFIDNKGVNR
jgi:hypothetical protein